MSTRLATRMSLLTAAFVAGLALSFTPITPVHADEDPVVRQPRARVAPPVRTVRAPHRVRTVVRNVERVRTVERVRYVPVYYTSGCGGCGTAAVVAPAPEPVAYRAAYTTCGGCAIAAPTYYAPRYYAPTYYSGCGGCAQPAAAPYYWAVRTARYWQNHGYYR